MRVRWLRWTAPLLLLAPGVARAETYSDEGLGFSIAVPDGYRQIPISGAEEYVVAKWQSEKEWIDGKEGYTHRPILQVVLFDPKGRKTAEVENQGDGVHKVTVKNPYRTYKDWIKSDASGGRYISKEEETKVNDVPTTWYEVAYEKLTVPRHGLAYVYHAPDIDYCVTTEVLEQHWDKASPPLFRALKSFKIFPRRGTVKRETTGDDDVIVTSDLSKLSPEDRLKRRTSIFEKKLRLASERLTDGWFVKRSKNYVALSHTDKEYTQRILDTAEAVRAWADANLAYYGDGIPGPEMLRICKDDAEQRAFEDLSSRSGGWTHEVTLSRNDGFWGFGRIANAIFDRWLDDKNPRLAFFSPPWLSNGLREWIDTAYMKNGRLEFRLDADTYIALKLAAKMKKLILPREMLQLTSKELSDQFEKEIAGGGAGGMDPFSPASRITAWQQAAGFVRFLLAGPGKSNARTKDLLKSYVTTLDAYVREHDEKPLSEGGSYNAPKTEEEEDEQFKSRQTFWKDHEKDLLKAVFERVFKGWLDADWAAVDKSYRAYAD